MALNLVELLPRLTPSGARPVDTSSNPDGTFSVVSTATTDPAPADAGIAPSDGGTADTGDQPWYMQPVPVDPTWWQPELWSDPAVWY